MKTSFCDLLRYLYYLKLINHEQISSINFIFVEIKSIKKKIVEVFNNIKQKNNEIEIYIVEFIFLYKIINNVIFNLIAVRIFINECKNTIKMQLKNKYQKNFNMIFDE